MLDHGSRASRGRAPRAATAPAPSSPLGVNGMCPPRTAWHGRRRRSRARPQRPRRGAAARSSAPGPNRSSTRRRTASRSMPRSRSAASSSWSGAERRAATCGARPRPASARARASAWATPASGVAAARRAAGARCRSSRGRAPGPRSGRRRRAARAAVGEAFEHLSPPVVARGRASCARPACSRRAGRRSRPRTSPAARALAHLQRLELVGEPAQGGDGAQADGRVLAGRLLGDVRCSGHARQRTLTRRVLSTRLRADARRITAPVGARRAASARRRRSGQGRRYVSSRTGVRTTSDGRWTSRCACSASTRG